MVDPEGAGTNPLPPYVLGCISEKRVRLVVFLIEIPNLIDGLIENPQT